LERRSEKYGKTKTDKTCNKGLKMSKLILKGTDKYIKRMYKHLRKEHPTTKKRMTYSK
jgi:hypothetical protein